MASSSANSGPLAAQGQIDADQVSAGQKMLSATWGSLLTSLLGAFDHFVRSSNRIGLIGMIADELTQSHHSMLSVCAFSRRQAQLSLRSLLPIPREHSKRFQRILGLLRVVGRYSGWEIMQRCV